jgi:hypothetical protein
MGWLEVGSLAEVSTEPAVQTMSCCSTKPDFSRKRGVKYVTNEGAAMQACAITQQAQARPATCTTTQEATELRMALREMHALASKYLAITGGGLSDGSEAEAVNRAATLLHCSALSGSAKKRIRTLDNREVRR